MKVLQTDYQKNPTTYEGITNRPTKKPHKIWRYYKYTTKNTLQHMKVLQIDQQKNLTKYEGITNRLTIELF
jgi:hypothetical protein